MMFIKAAPNGLGFVNPRHLGEVWREQVDWVSRGYDYAVLRITIDPDVSGKPHVLTMRGRLFASVASTEHNIHNVEADRRRLRHATHAAAEARQLSSSA